MLDLLGYCLYRANSWGGGQSPVNVDEPDHLLGLSRVESGGVVRLGDRYGTSETDYDGRATPGPDGLAAPSTDITPPATMTAA